MRRNQVERSAGPPVLFTLPGLVSWAAMKQEAYFAEVADKALHRTIRDGECCAESPCSPVLYVPFHGSRNFERVSATLERIPYRRGFIRCRFHVQPAVLGCHHVPALEDPVLTGTDIGQIYSRCIPPRHSLCIIYFSGA